MLLINNITIDGDLQFVYNDNYSKYIIFKIESNLLMNVKNEIDNYSKVWDNIKKLVNPYELIYMPSNNNSIADKKPVSRSYFKMIELLNDFNLLDRSKRLNIACLAEGPGGFIEAIYDYNNKTNISGITIKSSNKYIPSWKKIKEKNILTNDNISVTYGNLYNIEDVTEYISKFNHNVSLVTADGGLDYSINFNKQEQMSYRILFCEIACAVNILKEDGNFVIKFFDIFSIFTIKLIGLIKCFFEQVYVYKPDTSRKANSEKYIIAKGFIVNKENTKLQKILLGMISTINDEVVDILGITTSNIFIHELLEYNKKYINEQIEYINKTITYAKKAPDIDEYNNIRQIKIKNAKKWCQKYNVKII